MHTTHALASMTDQLLYDLQGMEFHPPVTHVYNPYLYARAVWDRYCVLYGQAPREVLMIGMNPGPWGMSQVGVPFGEVNFVRDWLKVEASVGKPEKEHPKRVVDGFACPRSEVSGRRLWGWAQGRYKTPEQFFERFFVYNYCPLAFMEESGRNRVPEKLRKAERAPLLEACDRALDTLVQHLKPTYLVGVGKFAEGRGLASAERLGLKGVTVGRILHPSPANPKANRGWETTIESELEALGLVL